MIEAVKKYATRVLLLHFLLLVIVVGVVLYVSRSTYVSVRDEAIHESSDRLELLSQQTARGIENYYLSVMSDLDAIMRDDTVAAATEPAAPPPTTQRGPLANGVARFVNRRRQMGEGRPAPVTQGLAAIMWRQLRGRVSDLFLIDNQTGRIIAAYPTTANTFAQTISKDDLDWFNSLKTPSMSHLVKSTDDKIGDYHLIAIPAFQNPVRAGGFGGGGGGGPEGGGQGGPGAPGGPPGNPADQQPRPVTVVAVVPVKIVKEEFFDPLNAQQVVNAALLDESGDALVSIDRRLEGTNVLSGMAPDVREKIAPFVVDKKNGAVVINTAYSVGDERFEPRIIVFEQISGLPGRQWTMLASTPLSEVEGPMDGVFREAVFGAFFVTVSVTAILISTSVFLIRSRMKLERQRHELLTRELDQARQIQMAWLPEVHTAPPGLEVWAANLPASHISGDFYNWFVLPSANGARQNTSVDLRDHEETGGKIAIVIGDVTGHGMAAAFLMATTQLLVRMTLSRYQDPGRCLQEVNRQLCTQGFRGQFVTMLVIVLDPVSNTMEIAVAGHPAPLVERNGKLVPLEMEPQLVLGVDPAETYKTQGFILEAGGSVLLYTDGVIEAENARGEQYSLERLQKIPVAAPTGCIDAILADVKVFCGEHELLDDVTLVALRTGNKN